MVNETIVCKAEFNLIQPEEIEKYTLKINYANSLLLNKTKLVKKLKDF